MTTPIEEERFAINGWGDDGVCILDVSRQRALEVQDALNSFIGKTSHLEDVATFFAGFGIPVDDSLSWESTATDGSVTRGRVLKLVEPENPDYGVEFLFDEDGNFVKWGVLA